jgi:membrane protein
VSWLLNVPVFARLRDAVARRVRAVWTRDRAVLHGPAAFANRAARILILTVRGILAHRIGLQGAALTYYTVFAIVPLLAVILWSLKLLDHLPSVSPELPGEVKVPTGNQLLHAALGQVLEAVDRTTEVTSGVVGLAVLLFAVSKLFGFTERALHIIAASGQRAPRPWRLLGYVALLLVAPATLAISGFVFAVVRGVAATPLSRVLGALPGFEVALAVALGFGALWLAVTLLYVSAVRARLPLRSSALGGALAALALIVIFWVFATVQVGASKAGALSSGFLAIPVFLLWVFSSWCAVLVGAEVTVAHHVDEVLVHGARSFRLDGAGERRAGVSIMVRLTELAMKGADAATEDALARDMRLPPALVRQLCFRLVDRGLLTTKGLEGFSLDCDPARTTSSNVAQAIDRDPRIPDGEAEIPPGASLRALAEAQLRERRPPPP